LIKKLREMVDGGVIGKVRMVQCNFGSTKPYDVDDRYFNADLAGGALLDIGVYAVAFLRYFLDQKPSVIVTSAEFAPTGVDETSGIILKTPSGMMAVCSLSLRSKQPKRGIISGEKGYIEIENYNRAESALIIRDGMEPETISLGSTAEALAYEAEGFQKAVERGYDETICQSSDVNEILSSVRNSWGHVYPFEERYLNR
ncbi:MAG: Gfo/Idh/MocA family protein, partial [Christensenellales bacterium]